MPPFFCASAMHVQRERGLAGGFRPVDLDHAAARQAADAERDVEAERAGGDRLDLHRLVVLAEPHDRALAEGALDLGERGIKGLRLVHGMILRRDAGQLDSLSRSLWPGIRRADNAPPAPVDRCRNRNVHYLFSVRNMFFSGTGCWPVMPSTAEPILDPFRGGAPFKSQSGPHRRKCCISVLIEPSPIWARQMNV